MSEKFCELLRIQDFPLWDKTEKTRIPWGFELEITSRCSNNCRHCFVNLPAGDTLARAKELSLDRIREIADEAVSLGALWCLITGGEPLLREDFPEIYLMIRRKGLLVSVFTNATLIDNFHCRLFKKYPPRDIEVTVYGVSKETYEGVTRVPGSYIAFRRGLDKLEESALPVRLKAIPMRRNLKEFPAIAKFCRQRTKDYFRFDPFLIFRYDRDNSRNREIRKQRLTPMEIVSLEQSDPERHKALRKSCNKLIFPEAVHRKDKRLFLCGAGLKSFSISSDGFFQLCSSLRNPHTSYNLSTGSLSDAWYNFVPEVRALQTTREKHLKTCHICHLINICQSCPAHAYLETGQLDGKPDYFCEVAHARAAALDPYTR